MENGPNSSGILSGPRLARQAAFLGLAAEKQGFLDRVPVEKAEDTAYRNPGPRPRLSIPSSFK
jgi:hypothetical protein